MAQHIRRKPVKINFNGTRWTLWADDNAHKMRMLGQIHGPRVDYDVLPGVPEFVNRYTRHRHVTRTHLQPFLRFKQGHTYSIDVNPNSQYVRDMPNPPGGPFIEATFHYYVYRNVPYAQMRVHNTNLTTIQENGIYVFDIRDFIEVPADITTPATRAQFAQERSESSGLANQMILKHIRNERNERGERFPVPSYLEHLQKYGGKHRKNRKTRKRLPSSSFTTTSKF